MLIVIAGLVCRRSSWADLMSIPFCQSMVANPCRKLCYVRRAEGGSVVVPALQPGGNDGSGNPPNPDGLKSNYLWRRALAPVSLTDILENYAQIVGEKNPKTGKKKRKQIFPRYHQLDVVRQSTRNSIGIPSLLRPQFTKQDGMCGICTQLSQPNIHYCRRRPSSM